MKTIQVLVVDDREENRNAAIEYFKTRESAEVEFAETCEEAIKMMDRKFYYYGIFNLKTSEESIELAKKADGGTTGVVIVEKADGATALFIEKGSDRKSFGYNVYGLPAKINQPGIWRIVFEHLESLHKINMQKARKSFVF